MTKPVMKAVLYSKNNCQECDDFTKQEKEINSYLMTYWEEMRLKELRGKFEKCWEIQE